MPVRPRHTADPLRHMKGKQVPVTLYLAPKQYWILKAASRNAGLPMQFLLRQAVSEVIRRSFVVGVPGFQPRLHPHAGTDWA